MRFFYVIVGPHQNGNWEVGKFDRQSEHPNFGTRIGPYQESKKACEDFIFADGAVEHEIHYITSDNSTDL